MHVSDGRRLSYTAVYTPVNGLWSGRVHGRNGPCTRP